MVFRAAPPCRVFADPQARALIERLPADRVDLNHESCRDGIDRLVCYFFEVLLRVRALAREARGQPSAPDRLDGLAAH